MEKKINYLSRDFDSYRSQLESFAKLYYPTVFNNFDDATIGSFLLDINAAVADNLSEHIDRTYQETQIDYAQNRKSLLALARANGIKVKGMAASVVNTEWTCTLPVSNGTIDWESAPIVKRGAQAIGGGQTFELDEDIDFSTLFDSDGYANGLHVPIKTSNNTITGYTVTKYAIMFNGLSTTYSKQLIASDVRPFMNIILPAPNVISIDSIIIKDENIMPTDEDFYGTESSDRWYEVDFLTDDTIFSETKQPETQGTIFNPAVGNWVKTTKKYITEYTDNGFVKITFGGGYNDSLSKMKATTAKEYLMAKMINNNELGEIPVAGKYIFIRYKIGGGSVANIGAGAITSFSKMEAYFPNNTTNTQTIRNSIKVTNSTPSTGGRDEYTIEELRNLIKYATGNQNRCVTLKDYYSKIMLMPPKYGRPYKCSLCEENNKIMIYSLSKSTEGYLSPTINTVLIDNVLNYLSKYRSVNDYLSMKVGRVINLQFEVDVCIAKYANKSDVLTNVISAITEFMAIDNHEIGENIYVSQIISKIYTIEGIKNIIALRVYNIFGTNYSTSKSSQTVLNKEETRNELDLDSTDNTLYSDKDSMFEIRYPQKDIKIRIKNSKY